MVNPFKVGDRVRFVSSYYPARVGDTGVVTRLHEDCVRVRLDCDPGTFVAPRHIRLELDDTPAAALVYDPEPDTVKKAGPGERYLDRAFEWLTENFQKVSVTDALLTAQFLESVDREWT